MGRPKNPNSEPKKTQAKSKKIQKTQKFVLTDNKFIIKKYTNEKEVVVEFPLMTADKVNHISFPKYRKDKLDFTPGFSLPDEFTKAFQKEQRILQEYRITTETSQIEIQHIKQPKPSSRNSYCTICKIRFEEYQQHVQLETHLSKMRASEYNKFIEELCKKKNMERNSVPQYKSQAASMIFSGSIQFDLFLDDIQKSQDTLPNSREEEKMEFEFSLSRKKWPQTTTDEELFNVLEL